MDASVEDKRRSKFGEGGRVRRLRCLFYLTFAPALFAGEVAPQTGPATATTLEVYTFADLLSKAERIVVAEVGPRGGSAFTIKVQETLKAPEISAKYVDPEKFKRAAELLANDKAALPPLPPARKPPLQIQLKIENIPLPPEGTQVIFFLWDRAESVLPSPAPREVLTYRVAHPQCLYDIERLPQVRAALMKPRSISDGRYLREWDKQMAEKLKERGADEQLRALKGGEPVQGIRLNAVRPVLLLRRDGSFSVTARVENLSRGAQAIYDGPGGGYGIRLRPKDADSTQALIVRVSNKNAIADAGVLNLPDITDFATIKEKDHLSRELFFDTADYPALQNLNGEYLLSVFFHTKQDGKGLDLEEGHVFTGTLMSSEVPFRFEKNR